MPFKQRTKNFLVMNEMIISEYFNITLLCVKKEFKVKITKWSVVTFFLIDWLYLFVF